VSHKLILQSCSQFSFAVLSTNLFKEVIELGLYLNLCQGLRPSGTQNTGYIFLTKLCIPIVPTFSDIQKKVWFYVITTRFSEQEGPNNSKAGSPTYLKLYRFQYLTKFRKIIRSQTFYSRLRWWKHYTLHNCYQYEDLWS
jgi:hypothetical protein